ncbi:MAG: hypothetical protein RL497_1151 [Pseudomonadota bacterium]|jgi:hypothetical protein
MAQHLLVDGYKNAAAVVCGSTLEAHLKQLCKKQEFLQKIPKSQKGRLN